eukprot:gene7877-9354_t
MGSPHRATDSNWSSIRSTKAEFTTASRSAGDARAHRQLPAREIEVLRSADPKSVAGPLGQSFFNVDGKQWLPINGTAPRSGVSWLDTNSQSLKLRSIDTGRKPVGSVPFAWGGYSIAWRVRTPSRQVGGRKLWVASEARDDAARLLAAALVGSDTGLGGSLSTLILVDCVVAGTEYADSPRQLARRYVYTYMFSASCIIMRRRGALSMDTNPMVQVGTSVEKLPTTQRTDGCALRPSVATANCEATSSASGILTEEQVAVISEKADALLDIPLLPSGLKAVLLMQAVKTVSLQLDRRLTHEQRQRVQALDVGAVPPEDFVEELVVTLRGAIDIPILDQPMEDEVLRVVLKAMLADQSVSSQVASSAAKSTISAFRALKDPRSREALVARLNKAVDLPLLDEEQEQ